MLARSRRAKVGGAGSPTHPKMPGGRSRQCSCCTAALRPRCSSRRQTACARNVPGGWKNKHPGGAPAAPHAWGAGNGDGDGARPPPRVTLQPGGSALLLLCCPCALCPQAWPRCHQPRGFGKELSPCAHPPVPTATLTPLFASLVAEGAEPAAPRESVSPVGRGRGCHWGGRAWGHVTGPPGQWGWALDASAGYPNLGWHHRVPDPGGSQNVCVYWGVLGHTGVDCAMLGCAGVF